MGREFELKYSLREDVRKVILLEYPNLSPIDMETTYYDTPDGALSALRWTLRTRFENGRCVCTVKTPAPNGGRGEWETEWDDILEAVPELCKLGAPRQLLLLTAGGVRAVCGARFYRLACTLELPECTLELAVDHGILLGGGRTLPLCEVELEHKSGSEAATAAFAAGFAKRYSLTPEPRSKFSRAMELARSTDG